VNARVAGLAVDERDRSCSQIGFRLIDRERDQGSFRAPVAAPVKSVEAVFGPKRPR